MIDREHERIHETKRKGPERKGKKCVGRKGKERGRGEEVKAKRWRGREKRKRKKWRKRRGQGWRNARRE